MDKKFKPKDWEDKIIKLWEEKKYFQAKVNKDKEPFVIILPPPNANGSLHVGHAMYVYEDILIRYNKFNGREVLWLPGEDHAGFETWYVFEKELKKQGKSKLDFDRDVLYQMVYDFVNEKRGIMRNQLKRLGFALDWSKSKFTLDEDIVHIVYLTFKKLFDQGLVYRGLRVVNFCVSCQTSFSDLEVEYQEEKSKLWTIKYLLSDKSGYIAVATTRPETMIGDTAVAVNPDDSRYKKLIGKTVKLPLVGREIPIIADSAVDPNFGTGAVKVTPAHSDVDWQIAQRHKLPLVQIIDFDGRANENALSYKGLSVSEFRTAVVSDLKKKGYLISEKDYTHRVGKCYKCKTTIEPLAKEQWFVKIKPLVDRVKPLLEKDKVKIYPKRFKTQLLNWLDKLYDWNISRQIVWGIRIPAYQCQVKGNQECQQKDGWFVSIETPSQCPYCSSSDFSQDEDTFDTWFSSGQWPYATLMSLASEGKNLQSLDEYKRLSFFQYFYPTTVMETGFDILSRWVSRMLMLGLFSVGKTPFYNVLLHGLVRDQYGQKMSKSKGNVIDPLELVDKYGADALRAALIFNTKVGSDVNMSEDKVVAMRNFANKVWNIGRFIYLGLNNDKEADSFETDSLDDIVENLHKEFQDLKKKYSDSLKKYNLTMAFDLLYDFTWHRLADYYLEKLKDAVWQGDEKVLASLKTVYLSLLQMLNPYMPFVTEAVCLSIENRSLYDID
ncbi:MAG: valine--tRNA ligase [Patescibacteria group bacterium]|nr:MAG: valine--tRNA ligase [Patescibacteria group bacterium]